LERKFFFKVIADSEVDEWYVKTTTPGNEEPRQCKFGSISGKKKYSYLIIIFNILLFSYTITTRYER